MATSTRPRAGMRAPASAVRTALRWPKSSKHCRGLSQMNRGLSQMNRGLPQMKRAAAEQAEQPGDDQIDGDDVVEQPRHDQNEDAGKQRNDWRETEIHMHRRLLWRNGATSY